MVRSATDSFALQLSSKEPSLFQLAKLSGSSDMVLTLLSLHLADVNKFLKVGNGLTDDEIIMVAQEVYTEYKFFFTFADIALVLRNAKLGKYGKDLYNRLSAADVMEWFRQYQLDKDAAVADHRSKENHSHMGSGKGNLPYTVGKGEDGRIKLTPKEKPKPECQQTQWQREQMAKLKERQYQEIKDYNTYLAIRSKDPATLTPNEQQFLEDYQKKQAEKPSSSN